MKKPFARCRRIDICRYACLSPMAEAVELK